MDKNKATRMLGELKAAPLPGYSVTGVLGNGKTAAVFKATDVAGATVALKVYESRLRETYGTDVDDERFRRELALKDHGCPQLVPILGGGMGKVGDEDVRYLVLGFLPGIELRQAIGQQLFSDTDIRKILGDVFTAVNFLLNRGEAHRDIKAENVMLLPNRGAVLLDLGVLRPIGLSALTDDGLQRPFLATRRYAPPELLHSRVNDTPDGWKAVTIYQIGTVLYELIHGSLLFGHISELHTFADLVDAVDRHRPTVFRTGIGRDLLELTRNALAKDPRDRLKLVDWTAIPALVAAAPKDVATSSAALAEVIRVASERYDREVGDLSERVRADNEAAMVAMRQALEVVARESKLADLGLEGVAGLNYETRDHVYHIVSFQKDLRQRRPQPIRVVIRLARKQEVIGQVLIDGLAIRGASVPSKAEECAKIMDASGALVERIWSGVVEENALASDVGSWVGRVMTKYNLDTEDHFNRELEHAKMVEESSRGSLGGMVIIRELIEAETHAFNSAKSSRVRRP